MLRNLFNIINTKSKKFYFLTPLPYSIGDSVEQIMSANSVCVKEKRNLVIIKIFFLKSLLKYKICNEALYKNLEYQSKLNLNEKIFIVLTTTLIVNISFVIKRILALLFLKFLKIKLPEHFFFPDIGCHHYYSDNISMSGKFLKPRVIKVNNLDLNNIKIHQKDKIKCIEVLKKQKIDITKKFVCIHIRDGAFKNDGNRKNRSIRNSNVLLYSSGIKYLLNQGYVVFRIGRISNVKLNFSHKNLIDYPFCNFKSDLMDMFLIQQCEFYIGNMSGPLEVAYMFNKPTLLLDGYRIFENYPRNKNCLATFKKIILDKKKITLKEYISLNYKYHHWKDYDDKIIMNESNENEITETIKSYLQFINSDEENINNDLKKFKKYLYKHLYKKYLKIINIGPQDDIRFIKKSLYWIKSSKGYYY